MSFHNKRLPKGISLIKSEFGHRQPWDPPINEEEIQQQPIYEFTLPPPPTNESEAEYVQSPLFTVPLKVMNAIRPYEAIAVNAMIDTGCNRTTISMQLAKDLGVLATPKSMHITGVHGTRDVGGGLGAYLGVQALHPVFGVDTHEPILVRSFQILDPFPSILAHDFSWLSDMFRLNIPRPVRYRGTHEIQVMIGQDMRKYHRTIHTRTSGLYSLETCHLGYQITREATGSMYHYERLYQAAAYINCGQAMEYPDRDSHCMFSSDSPETDLQSENVQLNTN